MRKLIIILILGILGLRIASCNNIRMREYAQKEGREFAQKEGREFAQKAQKEGRELTQKAKRELSQEFNNNRFRLLLLKKSGKITYDGTLRAALEYRKSKRLQASINYAQEIALAKENAIKQAKRINQEQGNKLTNDELMLIVNHVIRAVYTQHKVNNCTSTQKMSKIKNHKMTKCDSE